VLPFVVIIGLGVVVVAYTAFTTVLFGAVVYLLTPVLGGGAPIFLRGLEIVLSLGLGTLLFAIIFKLLPETQVEWRDVWLAAFLTGVVFTVLNYLFGVYLGLVQVSTLAGTAGSLMVLFLWIYLTDLFILFGVQFSRVYAQKFGSYKNKPITPKKLPRPAVDRVELTTEIDIKVQPKK
jgi:membrane protein